MVQARGCLRLPSKPPDERTVPGVLGGEDLDRDGALEGGVDSSEDLRHAAGAESGSDAVAAHENRFRHPFTPRYVSITCLAIGAATWPPVASLPRLPPSNTTTATTICGFPAGAKDTNQAWGAAPVPCWAVPVLPATVMPGILAYVPVPWSTTATIICVSSPAVPAEIGRL